MIRPAIETILAALLIAAALFVFIFGPAALHLALPNSAQLQLGLAGFSMLAGGYFFVGVWAAYPGWRNALVTLSALSTGLVVVLFVQRMLGS
jgi:hypothetical protein